MRQLFLLLYFFANEEKVSLPQLVNLVLRQYKRYAVIVTKLMTEKKFTEFNDR